MVKVDQKNAMAMMNELSAQAKPFVFFIDFDQEQIIISEDPTRDQIYFDFLGYKNEPCLLYTSPSPRDRTRSRMPSSA